MPAKPNPAPLVVQLAELGKQHRDALERADQALDAMVNLVAAAREESGRTRRGRVVALAAREAGVSRDLIYAMLRRGGRGVA